MNCVNALTLCSELGPFSEFARDMIMQLPYATSLPEEGSVFDYHLNLRLHQFQPWSERKTSSNILSTGYVPLPEVTLTRIRIHYPIKSQCLLVIIPLVIY